MRNPSFLFFLFVFNLTQLRRCEAQLPCLLPYHILFFFFFFYLHTQTRGRGRYRIIGCARSVSFVHLKENADRREEQSSPSCAPVPGTQFSRLIFFEAQSLFFALHRLRTCRELCFPVSPPFFSNGTLVFTAACVHLRDRRPL